MEADSPDPTPLQTSRLEGRTRRMKHVRKIMRGLFPLVAGAIFIYFLWLETPPTNNFWCDLQNNKGNEQRVFGNLHEKIVSIRIEGHAKKPTQGQLFDFSGRASVLTSTKNFEGTVHGSVFIDKSRQPNGLLLWLSSAAFGTDELGITTLNGDGMLDTSSSEAFLHLGPNLSAADRLAYPVTIACRANIQDGR